MRRVAACRRVAPTSGSCPVLPTGQSAVGGRETPPLRRGRLRRARVPRAAEGGETSPLRAVGRHSEYPNFILDIRSQASHARCHPGSPKGRRPVDIPEAERGAAPAGGTYHPAPGRPQGSRSGRALRPVDRPVRRIGRGGAPRGERPTSLGAERLARCSCVPASLARHGAAIRTSASRRFIPSRRRGAEMKAKPARRGRR
jgi:hypothetical protein